MGDTVANYSSGSTEKTKVTSVFLSRKSQLKKILRLFLNAGLLSAPSLGLGISADLLKIYEINPATSLSRLFLADSIILLKQLTSTQSFVVGSQPEKQGLCRVITKTKWLARNNPVTTHNLKVGGSNPYPATTEKTRISMIDPLK